jgi:hypothetical protein
MNLPIVPSLRMSGAIPSRRIGIELESQGVNRRGYPKKEWKKSAEQEVNED